MENKAVRNKGNESDILFSRCVKAGKRVYYIDVKCDRKGEYYLSITESKRLKPADDNEQPTFEKHKIFLYREDLDKFRNAFEAAVRFTHEAAPHADFASDWSGPAVDVDNEHQEEGEKPLHVDLEF